MPVDNTAEFEVKETTKVDTFFFIKSIENDYRNKIYLSGLFVNVNNGYIRVNKL